MKTIELTEEELELIIEIILDKCQDFQEEYKYCFPAAERFVLKRLQDCNSCWSKLVEAKGQK